MYSKMPNTTILKICLSFFPDLSRHALGIIGQVNPRYHIQRMRDISINFLNTHAFKHNSIYTSQEWFNKWKNNNI